MDAKTEVRAVPEVRAVRLLDGVETRDGAGVRLTRVLDPSLAVLADPFLLFDEFRSDSAEDYIGGFPPHPHRGFETVTYMMAGRMRHGDNHGHRGDLGPGGVQWMSAARGIVHEEMPQQEQGLMWGFQLWVNLPGAHKMDPPGYQDIPSEQIPEAALPGGGRVRVLAGAFATADGELRGPVRERPTAPTYLDLSLAAGAELEWALPEGHTALLHGIDGEPEAAGARLRPHRMAIVAAGAGGVLKVRAGAAAARLLLITGRALREPVAHYGPFVMNTREEVLQAVQDYQSGRF